MKISFATFALLLCSMFAWAAVPNEEWYKKLILEGQQKLVAAQQENAINDANGLSDRNHYVILVGEDTYPNGVFIKQRKGINKGAGDDVNYLLPQDKIDSMDKTLSTMNITSEIKTYVLVVSYIPMEFGNELTPDINIAEFFEGHSPDMVTPILDQASKIVSDITDPVLKESTTPTLYCGFVNFRVFKNEVEGFSQWVYYPRNNNVKYDEEYKKMLSSAVSRATWPKNSSVEKVEVLVDLISTSNKEYSKNKELFLDLLAINSPIDMEKALTGLSLDVLSAFNIGVRVHILKVLSAGVTPGSREVLINNLIYTVQTEDDANQLMYGLKGENDKVVLQSMKGWCLLRCITTQTSDGLITENYKALIKALISLCKKSKEFKDMVAALTNDDKDKIGDRMIFYNYNSFWSKMASTMAAGSPVPFPRPLFDRNTAYIAECKLQTKTEIFFNYFLPNTPVEELNLEPLEPIVFVNQSDLGMLGGFDDSKIFVSPAIILKYADEKAWNQTASDASMAVIDAASMATGYGEIKAGVMGMRKAWVMLDMANSGINLSLNASLATQNPTVKKILDLYNLATGGIAISRMATGGVKGVFKLIVGKEVLEGAAILDLLKTLDGSSDDALKALTNDEFSSIQGLVARAKAEADVKGLQEIQELATKVLNRMTAIGRDRLATLLKNADFKKIYDDLSSGSAARKFSDVFSLEEEAAIKFYTNESYYLFNKALIDHSSADDILAIEKLLNSTLDKLPTTPGKFFRGIGKDELDILKKASVGDEIPYDNFVSSSADELFAWRFLRNNKAKTGAGAFVEVISKNGKDIQKYSDASELEVLHKSKSVFVLESIEHIDEYILNIDDVALSGHEKDAITDFYRIVLVEK